MTISSAFDADQPSGGQGGGVVGPTHKNCANNRPPVSAELLGTGRATSLAPMLLLFAVSGTKTTEGSTHSSTPNTGTGLVNLLPVRAQSPNVLGGAFPQVNAKVALLTRGIEVTEIASEPVHPGEERPNAERPVGSMSRRVMKA